MFRSSERTAETVVAKLRRTTFPLGKVDTEQLWSLVSLPDIPMPDIGPVIDVCGIATLLPFLIFFFHGRQISIRINICRKHKVSRFDVVTEVCC